MNSTEKILKRINSVPSDGRPPIIYRIQIVGESLSTDDIFSFPVKHFFPRENLFNSLGDNLLDEEVKELEVHFKLTILNGAITIGAFLEAENVNRGDLIGCRVLYTQEKDNPDVDDMSWNSEKIQKRSQIIKACREKAGDVFSSYGAASIIRGLFLAVTPEYEGRGIATELLLADTQMSRLLNAPVTVINFTSEAAQKAAIKCGFQVLSELDVKTFRINDELVCPNPKWPIIKLMAKRHF